MNKKIIQLHPCQKKYTFDQDKACSPEETVSRFKQRLEQAGLDILREVKRIDNGRLDIPVYFSVCGRDALDVIGTKKQMGKGSTPEQSRASACMELAERYSFFSFLQQSDNFIVGDYAQMRKLGYPVLDIDVLLQSVHDTTHAPQLLEQLLTDIPLRWTWAKNLTRDEEVLVPFSWFYAINEFNGPSAGNTYEEAILQGISEVVERHVCAVINRDRLETPAIAQDSVTDPVARSLIEKFTGQGIQLYLNDFSLDTGIPTVAALAWDPATFPESSEIVFTAGTTPDSTKALIRALTEVAQLAGDFNSKANYVASGLPKPTSLDEVRYVIDARQHIALTDMADVKDDDMYREISNCVQALDRINMEVLVIDTVHPALNIPAAYTIIPGAHFRERASGGNGPLFAAKLAARLLPGDSVISRLAAMQQLLPDAYYLPFYMGCHLYEQGDISAARDHLNKSLSMRPQEEDLPYIYSYLGSCMRDLGRYDEAVALLKQGLDHDERRPDIHNTLGVCFFKQDRFDQAILHFTRAVELNPASAIDYANLALNQEKAGLVDAARENYLIALAQDPDIEFAVAGLDRLQACAQKK
ncbi:MAG TPA: tetratricopeptide repeat protein [Desulfobulbus sp.]|nr:tetratricopeptide repeat protein [Desulfobulbus sp.]